MANYSVDIEVGVKGINQFGILQKQIEGTLHKINKLNSKSVQNFGGVAQSVQNYSKQLALAEKALLKVQAGSVQEERAVKNYVTALGNANGIRRRQIQLIQDEINNRRQNVIEIEREVAANIKLTRAARESSGFGAFSAGIPGNIAVQKARRRKEQQLAKRGMMLSTTGEIIPGISDAGAGMQGPALPPQVAAAGRGSRVASALGKRLPGAISGGLIGLSFPLLFGQGTEAAVGGGIGGLAGGLLGPGGSFAGSLVGTLLGELAAGKGKIKELAADLGLTKEQTNQLAAAFNLAGANADQFADALRGIQGIGFTQDDQVEALKLVSKLADDYGGKIEKITAAYTSFAAKGAVSLSDINKFTAQGIPLLEQLEKNLGKNRSEILQLAKDGKISAQQVSDALVDIANKASTEAQKTSDPWRNSFKLISGAAGLLGDGLKVVFGGILKTVSTIAGKIAEAFGEAFNFIVRDAIATAAEISGALAQAANDMQYLTKLKLFGDVKSGARRTQKELLDLLNKPPEKLKPIQKPRLPGATTSGGAAGGPEDRTVALTAELQAVQEISAAENKIRDFRFFGNEQAAIQAEHAKTLADIERDRVKALQSANFATEKNIINELAIARIADANLKREDRLREEKQKQFEEQLRVEQSVRDSVKYFTDMRREQELQTQYSKTYHRLVSEGLLPAEAERVANFEKQVSVQKQLLDTDILLTQSAIQRATALGVSTDELQKQLDLLIKQRDELNQEAAKGAGPGKSIAERMRDEISAVQGELNKLTDPIYQITAAAESIGTAFSYSFAGIINGSLTAQEALANFFQNTANHFLDMAAQMIAKMIQLQILNAVLGILPGGGALAAGASAAATAAPKITGPVIPGINVPFGFAADGGPVSAGRPYVVGEKGPEMFVPRSSGSIYPNDAMGMGGANIVVNVDAGGSSVGGDPGQASQLGKVIGLAVQQELIKQKRPGGLLA